MLKNKVLLISILPDEHRNLSCLTLFSVAYDKDIDIELLYLPREKEYDQKIFKTYLKERAFSIIGLSVTTGGFFFAKQLTQDIKECISDSHVIWGGIHPTTVPAECLSYADSICVGEGEGAFITLIEKIFNNKDISNIPGIWLKDKESQIIQNQISPPLTCLDSLPVNRYNWSKFYILDNEGFRNFSHHDYAKYSKHNGDGYTLMTSRSCPYSCSFCINSFLNKLYSGRRHILKRSVENVLRELKYAISDIQSIKFINFIDDHFLTTKEWTDEFCRVYKKEIALPFMIRSTPNFINQENIVSLKDAGLVVVQIGIQTGSEKVNKEIYHRQFDRNKLIEVSMLLKQNKIKPIFDIIIQSEFEDDSDRDKTIELLMELERPFECSVFSLTAFPETEIAHMLKRKGITPKIDPYYNDYLDHDDSDWYYQMANIAGSVSKETFSYLYQNHHDQKALNELKILFSNKRQKSL
ncbi:MAG: radical SAM protein [Victivallaceae bacterium]|jgi:radical SAM superfamily enzyme YgiQ (UPF0313 family)